VLVIRNLKKPKSLASELEIIALALVWSIVSQLGSPIDDQLGPGTDKATPCVPQMPSQVPPNSFRQLAFCLLQKGSVDLVHTAPPFSIRSLFIQHSNPGTTDVTVCELTPTCRAGEEPETSAE
jgi:hypothetical protein